MYLRRRHRVFYVRARARVYENKNLVNTNTRAPHIIVRGIPTYAIYRVIRIRQTGDYPRRFSVADSISAGFERRRRITIIQGRAIDSVFAIHYEPDILLLVLPVFVLNGRAKPGNTRQRFIPECVSGASDFYQCMHFLEDSTDISNANRFIRRLDAFAIRLRFEHMFNERLYYNIYKSGRFGIPIFQISIKAIVLYACTNTMDGSERR